VVVAARLVTTRLSHNDSCYVGRVTSDGKSGLRRAATRFFDSRAAYMMFVTTTTEKATVAARVGEELDHIGPGRHGLRVLDAGMGDASVLSYVMRGMHRQFTHIPWLVVGKEISIEDVRQALERLPDRLYEHPEMVFVVTNMNYGEAPSFTPRGENQGRPVTWRHVPLEGGTTHDFAGQIRALYPTLAADWKVETDRASGNPKYMQPTVVVLHRRDRQFILDPLIPRPDRTEDGYDLVIASHPYRARTPPDRKARLVVVPMVSALAPGGRLVTVHAYGHDPGLEIIRGVWPDENPFDNGRKEIIGAARRLLGSEAAGYEFHDTTDEEAVFRYDLHAMPSEAEEHIGTSSILAAWNAAAYVAQIDEVRPGEAVSSGRYIEATRNVIDKYRGVWFFDEAYTISRRAEPPA